MASNVSRFLKFQQLEGGVLPPRLAAQYLGISPQALNQAIARKRIDCIRHAGRAYCGLQSLRQYKEWRSAVEAYARNSRLP